MKKAVNEKSLYHLLCHGMVVRIWRPILEKANSLGSDKLNRSMGKGETKI